MKLKKHASGEFLFRNPKWTTTDTIEVEVEHDEFGWIPFSASADDVEGYGRELFELLSTKHTDQVKPCPQSEKDAAKARDIRRERTSLLAGTDWTQLADVSLEIKNLWAPYRQALRDVPAQTGFPYEITWPTPPA